MSNTIQATWVKSVSGEWLDLLRLDLNSSYFVTPRIGVYGIWYSSPGKSKMIRVGQGDIKERLQAHRDSPEILGYARLGTLKVTWTILPNHLLDNAELALAARYAPLIGERFPSPTQEVPFINPIQ